MIANFQKTFFTHGQVRVGLSRVKTLDYVLLIRKEEDDCSHTRLYHQMSAVVKCFVLREAVGFVNNDSVISDFFQAKRNVLFIQPRYAKCPVWPKVNFPFIGYIYYAINVDYTHYV